MVATGAAGFKDSAGAAADSGAATDSGTSADSGAGADSSGIVRPLLQNSPETRKGTTSSLAKNSAFRPSEGAGGFSLPNKSPSIQCGFSHGPFFPASRPDFFTKLFTAFSLMV
jgi:hypothetical protein